MNEFSPESSVEPANNVETNRRRAYKACLHCRSRKAKCDLGNIDSPSQPPCARCKRESRECIFAPSFRGGKIVRRSSTVKAGEGSEERPPERRAPKKNMKEVAEHRVTFSTSDIDLDELKRSGSEGPPRKIMRLDSGSGSEQVGDNDRDQDRVDPQSLAAASLRNPTDALNLLALAADVDRKTKTKKDTRSNGYENSSKPSPTMTDGAAEYGPDSQVDDGSVISCDVFAHADKMRQHVHKAPGPPPLQEYALIKSKILSQKMLAQLVKLFFAQAHAVFPMVPYHRIPQCTVELARFAAEEPALLTVIVVIVSRQEKMTEAHERSWEYMQTLINELILGKIGSVGTVEALLLLSENLPRRTEPATEDEEHRMAWMLVGMAVRTGYMLGLDQKTLRPLSPGADDGSGDTDEQDENERIDRERLAWTYCYIFDRSISIRSGKAFWSRGPGLCFQRTHSGTLPSVSEAFPSLRPIKGVQDDFSAMLQAYTELTQIMASAHDVLYPSKDRTIALVRVGDYHKYLDELTRSINGFRLNWEEQVWETTIVSECVWISFHYTRLYIYAFAFQAHVQRSTSTSKDGKKIADNVIFPRGPMGSPDARFILEAIDAATELLHFCVEKLRPSGAMSYLPWRFFLYSQYAGVFLLKAVFVGAVVPQDQRTIVQLVKRVIICLANASSDEQHCGVRYARLLNGLLKVFSRGVDGVTSRIGSPKSRASELTTDLQTTPTPKTNEQPVAEKVPTRISNPSPALTVSESTESTLSEASQQSAHFQPTIPTPPLDPTALVRSPGTEAILAHLPMPRLDASEGPLTMRHLLAPTTNGFQGERQPSVQALNPPSFGNGLSSGPYQYPAPPSSQPQQQQQQQPSQHHQLYPSAHAHGHPPPGHGTGYAPNAQQQPTSGDTGVVNGVNGNVPFNMYQANPAHGHGATGFPPFDLNWPAMEPDGLAQMLADDHALNGDFWMSLSSRAQWQTWPQANGGPGAAPP